MSGAHTPTPYVVNGFGGDFQVVARLEPRGVAISSSAKRGDEIETARFIVTACNSHATLLAEAATHNAAYLSQMREIGELREALEDIREWCLNAKRSTGVVPYGLAVAERALSRGAKP